MEHFVSFAADQACGEALAALMTTIVKGDVSKKIADLLSSETSLILVKKDAETMAIMKEALGADYVQPQRPLGMGFTLVKIASNYALTMLLGSLGAAVGPSQFLVETKGGCNLMKCALQMAMKFNGSLAATCLDGINAFGEIE